jgi:hypothetical protein
MVPFLPSKLAALPSLTSKWKKFHLPILARASIFKTYVASIPGYHMFMEPLSQGDYQLISGLEKWFIWSPSTDWPPSDPPHSKMSEVRLLAPRNSGGLGLWDWQKRSDCLLAKLYSWLGSSPNLDFRAHWIASQSPLATRARALFNQSGLPFGGIDPVKEYMKSIHGPPTLPLLTPTQFYYQTHHHVRFPKIWKSIRKLTCPCKVRSLVWQVYSKTLPLMHSNKQSHPHLESTMGIFFNLPIGLRRTIRAIQLALLHTTVPWNPGRVLPLDPSPHPFWPAFCACVMWGLWQWRNSLKHGPPPSLPHFQNTVVKEIRVSLANSPISLASEVPGAILCYGYWTFNM